MRNKWFFLFNITLVIFVCQLHGAHPSVEDLPEPYCDLNEVMEFSGHGWYANRKPMEALIEEVNPKIVIELGSWLGLSTRHIAETISEDGILYAVDHWLGSPQSRINNPHLIPTLYEQFLSNIIHAGLTHKVVPIKMTTLEAVHYFHSHGIAPDLIYVDASHEEQDVYNDLVAYFPLVKGYGVICGDDWGFGNDLPVQKAVKRFAAENHLRIEVPNNWFWILRE